MSILAEDLCELTSAELAELCEVFADGELSERAAAEVQRRKTAGLTRAREAQQRIYAEWRDAMHADYEAADRECCGNLLSPEGKAATVRVTGQPLITDEHVLWSMSARDAERYASWELKDFWRANGGRRTFGQYRRQRAAAMREAREMAAIQDIAEDITEDIEIVKVTTDEQHAEHRPVVEHDAEAGLRHERAADAVRAGRDGQLDGGAEAGRVRDAGPVLQPGRLTPTQSGPVRVQDRPDGRDDLAARRAAKAGRAQPVAPRTAPAAGRSAIVWTAEVATADGTRTLARGVADPMVAMQACAASPESMALGMAGVRLSFGQQSPARWAAGAHGVQFTIIAEQAGRIPA